MAVVLSEGWGGNRVYKGSAWMELYYAVKGELNGDPAWSLTGNGKLPNWMTSVFLAPPRSTGGSPFPPERGRHRTGRLALRAPTT